MKKEENPYKILPDLFSDLPERQQGEGSLTGFVQYETSATKYLEWSKIRTELDFTTQHIARPHNPVAALEIIIIRESLYSCCFANGN